MAQSDLGSTVTMSKAIEAADNFVTAIGNPIDRTYFASDQKQFFRPRTSTWSKIFFDRFAVQM